MSFRSLIAPALLLMLAACDRHISSNEQAAAPAPAPTSSPTVSAPLDRSHKGEAPPAVTFADPADKPVTLAGVIAASGGKPVLVNLWATWCGPCIKEMPTLDATAIRVVAISQDKDRTTVAAFFGAHKFARLQPYLDKDTRLSIAFDASLPMSVLYDSGGHEVWRTMGGMDWTSASAKALLAEAG